MKKFADWIVKSRIWIMIVVAVLTIASAVATYFVITNDKINSDMLVYLPGGTDTADGIKFLKENFGVEGDAFVVVSGYDNDPELAESVGKIRKIEGITNFIWYGDLDTVETLAKFFHISDKINVEDVKSYLKRPIYEGDEIVGYNYVMLILLDYSPSTQEAFNVHDMIRAELNGNLGRSVAISGMTALADTVMTNTMAEIPYYLLFSAIVVIIILLLSTDSFLDPAVLMITMGIAVLINMGTNYVLPDVSIISFAASSVLQLGITMDYAIFLLHTFKEERIAFDPYEAAKRALPRTMINVLASGLTTMGGFAALYFMRFTIGADLANVIIKGVALSLITVVFLQPCLLIYFDNVLKKTTHKKLFLNIEPLAKGIIKGRIIIVVIAVLLIAPAFIGQANVKFSYLKIYDDPVDQTAQEKLAAELQNQVIIAVPLETKEGTHREFMAELISDPKIDSVLGAYSVINMEEKDLEILLDTISDGSGDSILDTMFAKVGETRYTLYLVEISGDTEDAGAFATHAHLESTLNKYFADSYPLGVLNGVADMADVTPGDFMRVTLISIAIILVVMSILLKSVRKSVMMVALIELAIWINISLNTIFGVKLNFMIYIIISSVQLGCTVDYAILLSTRFEEMRKKYEDAKEAIVKALVSAFPAITTSVSIIMAVCLSIYFVSKNLLVKEMAQLMTRGAFISYILVMVVLPCVLLFMNKLKPIRFRKKEDKSLEGEVDESHVKKENTNAEVEEG